VILILRLLSSIEIGKAILEAQIVSPLIIVSDLWLLGPTLTLHNYDSDLLTMSWNFESSLLSCLPNQLSMSNLLGERFLGEIISALSGNSATLVAQEWKNYRERK
jgi:hypothetical protein